MKNIKKILLLFLVCITIGAIWFYRNWRKEEFMPAKENTISINLGNESRPLFLRAKIWGVAGNHEQIILSQSNNNVPNKTDDYIFYTTEIFYKVGNDNTVIIYAIESSISEPVNKIPNVTVKGLKTADEIRNYNTNYQKYGLKRISVYE
jgi:hypothetical protein